MYDYSIAKDDKRQFIRTFFRIGDTITIIFGDGKPYNIEYSEIAMKNLDKTMHRQVNETTIGSLKKRVVGNAFLMIGGSVVAMAYASNLMTLSPNMFIPIAGGMLSIYGLSKTFSYTLKAYDLAKNKMFVDMENRLNFTANISPEIFQGIESKIPSRTLKNKGYSFNLTDVDHMSYKTVKALKQNLENVELTNMKRNYQANLEVASQKKLIKSAEFHYTMDGSMN